MDILEHLVRSFARRTTVDGHVALITNGHPALVRAFEQLGWSDPHIDPDLQPPTSPTMSRSVTATATAPERAVMPPPKVR